jgi:hypothetical protein
MEYLMKILILGLLASLSLTSYADHHAPPENGVVEIYECNLNEGASVANVVRYGRDDFKKFVDKNKISVNAFIWDPVAVAPPYHEAQLRWINYYPSWAEFSEISAAWTDPKNAKNRAALAALTTCKKPVFATSMPIAQMPSDKQKPLIVGICNLNEGATSADVQKYITPGRNQHINDVLGTQNGAMMWMPGFGLNPDFDFLQVIAGSQDDMMTLFDGVRTGKVQKAHAAYSDQAPPMSCTWDLSTSYSLLN